MIMFKVYPEVKIQTMRKNTYLTHIYFSIIFLLSFGVAVLALELKDFSLSSYQNNLIVHAQTPSVPAFPGAEGFGAQSKGGRGGRVVKRSRP